MGEQVLWSLDLDPRFLAASREDLLVQQPVARVRGHRLFPYVDLAQGGQDADHRHPAAHPPGAVISAIHAFLYVFLQLGQRIAGQRSRRDIDLQVELAELGGPAWIVNGLQCLGALHRRRPGVIHQVELDLETHLLVPGIEPVLAEHLGEDIQATVHLLAVATPVLLAHGDRGNFPAHRPSTP